MDSSQLPQFDHSPNYWMEAVLDISIVFVFRFPMETVRLHLVGKAANTLPVSCIPSEENVYRLCKKLSLAGIADREASDLYVVFISNDKKQIPLWHQKASHRADGIILWDYHVICVQIKGDDKSPQVWDLDSTLAFPSPLASYIAETFHPSFQLFSEYQRFYRIVHAPIFLRRFASDRRHMKDSDGNWTAQPPSYDPIVAEDGAVHNLNEYMEIHGADAVLSVEPALLETVRRERLGVVLSENQIEEFFSMLS